MRHDRLISGAVRALVVVYMDGASKGPSSQAG